MGRRTKYNKEMVKQVEDEFAKGLPIYKVCNNVGISPDSFARYKAKYAEFAEAIKKGKEKAITIVESALFKRATGFNYIEKRVEVQKKGKKEVSSKAINIEKTVLPDTTACIFFLKNRNPEKWKDKHDIDLKKDFKINVIIGVPGSF